MAFPRISNGFISEKIIFNEDLVLVTVNLNRKLPRIKAGQFVHLALTEYLPDKRWPESRVFSVANKTDGLSIKLLISRQGAFTSFLIDKININAKVSVKGPYGEFAIKENENSIVLLSGGSGISAFTAFLEAGLEAHSSFSKCKITLLYGARNKELLVFRDLVKKVQNNFPNFNVVFFAEELEESNIKDIIKGRIDLGVLDWKSEYKSRDYYISGGQDMINFFKDKLTNEYSIDLDSIYVDAWE